MTQATEAIPSIRILNTRVHMIRMAEVVALIDHWIEEEPHRLHHVVNTGMHGIMEGHNDREFGSILNSADILAPDGILAIIVARLHGYRIRKQDTGPELLWRLCEAGKHKTYKYFFYGDTLDTLHRLSSRITKEFPNIEIVGYHSPPFRPLTPDEDESMIQAINHAAPDVLWVGLGMPQQEKWINEHRDSLKVTVAVGAGASLKFLSGSVSRAPDLVCNLGFEWLWRLVREPRRVWRRVFIDAPQFIGLVFFQLIGLKKYE